MGIEEINGRRDCQIKNAYKQDILVLLNHSKEAFSLTYDDVSLLQQRYKHV